MSKSGVGWRDPLCCVNLCRIFYNMFKVHWRKSDVTWLIAAFPPGAEAKVSWFPHLRSSGRSLSKIIDTVTVPKKNTWSSSPSDCHPRFLPQYMLHCKAACGLVKGSWWNNTSTAVSCQEFASNLSWLRIKRLRHVAVNLYWHGDHSQLFANIQSSWKAYKPRPKHELTAQELHSKGNK